MWESLLCAVIMNKWHLLATTRLGGTNHHMKAKQGNPVGAERNQRHPPLLGGPKEQIVIEP